MRGDDGVPREQVLQPKFLTCLGLTVTVRTTFLKTRISLGIFPAEETFNNSVTMQFSLIRRSLKRADPGVTAKAFSQGKPDE